MGFLSRIFDVTEKVDSVLNHDRLLRESLRTLTESYSNVQQLDEPTFISKFSALPADDRRFNRGTHPLKRPTLCMPKLYLDANYWNSRPATEEDANGGDPVVWLVTFFGGGIEESRYDEVFLEMFPSTVWLISTYHGTSVQYGDIHNWFLKTLATDFRVPMQVINIMEEIGENGAGWRPAYEYYVNLNGTTSRSFVTGEIRTHEICSAQVPYEQRKLASEEHNLQATLAYQNIIVQRAEAGDRNAQRVLSDMYFLGHGFGMLQGLIQEDRWLALEWRTKCIDPKSADDLIQLGHRCNDSGKYEIAYFWYREAAEMDHHEGVLMVGQMQEKLSKAARPIKVGVADGEVISCPSRIDSLIASAEEGSAGAMIQLGILYQYGLGVDEDIEEAKSWYEQATNHGGFMGAIGMRHLGLLYRDYGDDSADLRKGEQLLKSAADQGDPYSGMKLGIS
jgi:TPR repeat protein